ncbi:hypothetical protein JCGZ_23214 [Jatropha curcas]|uniref:TRF2/HOY1 PH-like domain-containing protein n=1 Tax=Jatropha curcas TaxID=180498 RepID=A0A067JHG0_JATCU|nr:hypothetical protein JCGZ_23214 [Jatropha curcas]
MARELAGSSRTFLCSDKNGEFSVTGEFLNTLYEFANRGNDQDKSSFFGIQCTNEAADKRIKETPKQNNKQVEMADTLLNLRPLGLKLSVTPSLLDLAEKKLNHCKYAVKGYHQPKVDDLGSSEKLKAGKFKAKLLKIGNWKIESYYEDHLVAKCYYARRMLLWEILERGLKNKIEIHWNDIIAMRAIIQENQPGILELELNRVPKLHVEKDPQARKHSDWKKADDFTGGQVSTYRRHYLQFPPGSFDKHYEKLLKCDQRLYELCHKPFPSLQSPYFDPVISRFSDFSFDYHGDHRPDINLRLPFNFSVIPSPLVATQTSFQATPSPISVIDFSHSDEQNSNKIVFDDPRMTLSSPTIQFSHQVINPAISYQNYANPSNYGQNKNMLTSIGYQLFSDRQVEGFYEEQYHMARVESLNELVNLPQQLQEEENGSQQTFYEYEMGSNEQIQVISAAASFLEQPALH